MKIKLDPHKFGEIGSPHRTCQYPYGTPGNKDFRFCGWKTVEGRSYCAEHMTVCYRPAVVKVYTTATWVENRSNKPTPFDKGVSTRNVA